LLASWRCSNRRQRQNTMAEYKYLFTPLKLGPITLKNRIVYAGHGNQVVDPVTFFATDRAKAYYEEKARGGAAMIALLLSSVDEKADYYPASAFALWTDDVIPGLTEITDIIHKYDCKVFGAPGHPGVNSSCHVTVDEVERDASQIPGILQPHMIPKALTREEIWEIQDKFAAAAVRLVKAGVDGIEMLHGHGKLTWNFFSPITNKRTDEYGGSLENRFRFTLEMLDKIRQAVGKDFPLGMRLQTIEMEPGGISIDDAIEMAKILEATGQLSYLALTTGTYRTIHIEINPYYASFEPGWAGEFSRKVKAAVKLPISISSKINDPGLADRMIADGQCDYVYLARATIADPHFAKKAMEGREEDIRPCIYCNQGCVARAFTRGSTNGIRCTVNPTAGEELRWGSWTFEKAPKRKKVLVVGSGPAGLQCALTSAERGHDVVIYDRENELGGQARLIKKLPSQTMPQTFIDYLDRQLQKLGVKINLGVELTDKNINEVLTKESPDVVVMATGARPARDGTGAVTCNPIPGWDRENVYTYEDVLLGKTRLGEKVLIVDDFNDRVSPGIAELLAEQSKKVEIMTFRNSLSGANLVMWLEEPFVMAKLDELGVKITPYSWVKEITEKGVVCFNAFSGREFAVEADNIILVTAKYSNTELYDLFKQRGIECHLIGDARAPRWIWNATHDGYKLARET
jgi:2,4-dienoyl-CoA reductase-like NADH-dependent reductase (Old Yellow Enzyme family)/thioredoxin reductase